MYNFILHVMHITCGKRLLKHILKILKFQIAQLLNNECFLNVGSKLISFQLIFHQFFN
jgi:hypothetical protein